MGRSAIDGRTTRHRGYALSQRRRKRVEEVFGWLKTVGGGRKLRDVGQACNRLWLEFAAAAYNLGSVDASDRSGQSPGASHSAEIRSLYSSRRGRGAAANNTVANNNVWHVRV